MLRRLSETLGHAFIIERELGGGGMSRAFLAEETAFGRRVVVKVLVEELMQELSAERFTREFYLTCLETEPLANPLRADPPFDAIMRRVGARLLPA